VLKFRIIGRPAEVEQAAAVLSQVFNVDEMSTPYDSRTPGKVRVYVEAELRTPVQAEAERVDDDPPATGRTQVDPGPRKALPPGRARRPRRRY
jgi:hypothetical protein